MSYNFYTSVVKYGNNILYRGIKNGSRIKLKVQYAPTLFLSSNAESEWKNLQGESLSPIKFESINDANSFLKRYENVENFNIFGNSNFAYSFIADEFPGMVDWSKDLIAIDVLDIETGSENGFPNPYEVKEPITAITITRFGKNPVVFGCGDYKVKGSENYTKCSSEIDLCQKFISYWEHNYPDILTGWNTRYFDIPYLFNRFKCLLGEKEAKKLSPWGMVNEKKTFQRLTGKELTSYDIVGIGHLDYIELYKNFAKNGKSQENYRLDTVANFELKEKKLSYDEYDNLHQLYKQNYQKFIEYNIKDVDLIIKLEDKLKLIDLALTLTYDTKSGYEDIFTQTRMWDAIIYNYLIERKIVVPPKDMKDKDSAFEGAYVKVPQIGMHKDIASFDLDSLYPHLIMQYNISPEALIEPSQIISRKHQLISELRGRL